MTSPNQNTIAEYMREDDGSSFKEEGGIEPAVNSGRIEGLDGLRAVAVLSVFLFHILPQAVPGGFIGVDVFFVISGFLITTLLLRERAQKGQIDLRAFYVRRARRLIPALVLVMVTSVAIARIVSDDLLVNIKRQVLGALTFSTNWVEIFAGSNYFDETSRPLFLTFWSLAVEEQFYLIWPVALIALGALTRSGILRGIFALAAVIGSVFLMVVFLGSDDSITRVYYGTDTHCFGLMIGVALAFIFDRSGRFISGRLWNLARPWIGFSSLTGLAALVVLIDSNGSFTYPWGLLLASLLSAGTVAALPGTDTAFTRFCRTSGLAWIGERSYGIYLWHWPVLLITEAAMGPVTGNSEAGWVMALTVITLTLALSEASFRWIETPVRQLGFSSAGMAFISAFKTRYILPLKPTAAVGFTVVLCVLAALGILNAPAKSKAQLSVESGEDAIAEQNSHALDTTSASKPGSSRTGDPSSPPGDSFIRSGEDMVGFGDSVMSGAASTLYKKFPGIDINAKPILQWRDAPAMVRQAIEKGKLRRIVILNFGTNAGFKEAASEMALSEILNLIGPERRVVLVNTVGISNWVPSTNEKLVSISTEYPNTIVADWNSVVRENPGLLHRDRTHPNDAGCLIYANTIASALEKLGRE